MSLPIVQPSTSRCTGHCCHDIQIPYSRTQLHAMAMREAAQQDTARIPDSVIVAAMLRPLVGPSPKRFDANGDPVWITEAHHRYSCIHLQPDGNCGDYENRPRMCSEYPYGMPCKEPGCTWAPEEAIASTMQEWQREMPTTYAELLAAERG